MAASGVDFIRGDHSFDPRIAVDHFCLLGVSSDARDSSFNARA